MVSAGTVGVMEKPPEKWAPYPGFPGYSISSYGRVMSYRRLQPREVRPQPDKDGYAIMFLSQDSGGKRVAKLHRSVATAFLGAPPEGKTVVNHRDGQKANNAVENLEWASIAENNLHARRVLGVHRGEKNPTAKLTATRVAEIRARYGTGISMKNLGREFGVCAQTICNILHNRIWA